MGSATKEDVALSPAQGLNAQNKPLASWLVFGGTTETQLKWIAGGLIWDAFYFIIFPIGSAGGGLALPWLLGGLVAAIGGWRWNREGVEHTRLLWLRGLLRPRVYAVPPPPPPGEWFVAVGPRRWGWRVRVRRHALGPWGMPAGVARALGARRGERLCTLSIPFVSVHRAPGDLMALTGAHIIDDGGVARRRVGGGRAAVPSTKKAGAASAVSAQAARHVYVATVDALPVILRAKTMEDREEIFDAIATEVAGLRPGERLQLRGDNLPRDIDAVCDQLEARRPCRTPFFDEMNAREDAWMRDIFGENYAVDARFTITLAGPERAALLRRVRHLIRTLDGVGSGGHQRDSAGMARALWESVSVEAPPPDDGACDAPLLPTVRVRDPLTLSVGSPTGEDEWWLRSFVAVDVSATVMPLALSDLSLMNMRSRISYTFEGLDRPGALETLRRKARGLMMSNAQVRLDTGHDDRSLTTDAQGISEAYIDMKRGVARMVKGGVVFTLCARSRAELMERAVDARTALEDAGLTIYDAPHDQIRLFAETLPLCLGPTRPFRLMTRPWPFMPLALETPGDTDMQTVWGRTQIAGQIVGHSWREGATPAIIFVADQGIGKSAGMATLIHSTLREGNWATIVDPSQSFPDYVDALNERLRPEEPRMGVTLTLLEPGVAINLVTLAGVARDNRIPALIDVFEIVYGRGRADYALSGAEETALDAGLHFMFARAEKLGREPRTLHLARYFRWRYAQERRKAGAGVGGTQEELYGNLWRNLRQFHSGGTYASLLDQPTTIDIYTPCINVNTRRINRLRGVGGYLGVLVATTLADVRTYEADRRGLEHMIGMDEAHNTFELAGDWWNGNTRYIRHEKNRLAACTHKVSDLLANPKTANSLTAIKKWVILRCSDRLDVLEDTIGLPPHLIKRARRLRQDKDRSEGIYVNNQPGADTKYGVFDFIIQKELLGLVESYKEQKLARRREILEAGGAAAAMFKRVARPTRGRHKEPTKEEAA